METRSLVDPELLRIIDRIPQFSFTDEELPGIRQMTEQLPQQPGPTTVSVEERFIKGPAGSPEVRLVIYLPMKVKTTGVYLHFHAGGYVLGRPEMCDLGSKLLCEQLGCPIVSVDYRRSPETRFPGAIEDCYAALKWLHTQPEELNIDPQRIAIGGESAGGGLAACLALLARDRRELSVIFQSLVYPMLDDRTAAQLDSHANPYTGEFFWKRQDNLFGWRSLLGHAPGGITTSIYAAAARADDLGGLPPAFISVGSLDLFVDESLEYAHRLMRAGVRTELHVYPGAFHAFDIVPDTKIKERFDRDRIGALQRALQTSTK